MDTKRKYSFYILIYTVRTNDESLKKRKEKKNL